MIAHSGSPLFLIIGTRPEAIKMIPVYRALKLAHLPVFLYTTGQHDHLVTEVLALAAIVPDHAAPAITSAKDLSSLTEILLESTNAILAQVKPSLVIVQGDTTSAMVGALSAFYHKIPVAHVEAGLRSHILQTPFPEEMNRRVISTIASYHFAPTAEAVAVLKKEGIAPHTIVHTGNTAVDALYDVQHRIAENAALVTPETRQLIEHIKVTYRKYIVLTLHRRESWDGPISCVLSALKRFLQENQHVACIYPYHPNPRVIASMREVGIEEVPNFFAQKPLSYIDMIFALTSADLIVTDSGGIQEEAVSLAKPILVTRNVTERPEVFKTGLGYIIGTESDVVYAYVKKMLDVARVAPVMAENPYGDGTAATKIAAWIQEIQGLSKNKNNLPYRSMPMMMSVCIVGLGYIGLPTAVVAAESGCYVAGFDINEGLVLAINKGNPETQEPDLIQRLQLVLASNTFHAAITIESADYYIVAVPTPYTQGNQADLSYVYSALTSIASVLKKGDCIILESTVPVGTTEQCATFLTQKTGLVAGVDFFLAHCPERVCPGNIFYELVHNDRVIGGINEASLQAAKKFYSCFVQGKLYLTSAAMAELVKLTENSSRDVQIAFSHQIAAIAQSIGLDPYQVIELANKHPRVSLLKPTCGVGGHCLAVDPWFLIETFPEHTQLLHAARVINDNQPFRVIEKITAFTKHWQQQHGRPCTIALLGVTYKPNVNDLRESPALRIAQHLEKEPSCDVFVCEPHVQPGVLANYCQAPVVSANVAIPMADLVVYLVAHARFNHLQREMLEQKAVMDFCGILHKSQERQESKEFLFWPASEAMHVRQQ